jgi:LmbE family N-acetylglucosaminyl deacetylase
MRFAHFLALVLFFSSTGFADPKKNVLLIFPHPDDETMVRSVIMRLVEAGDTVSAIYLTRGEGGRDQTNHASAELATTRTAELERAGQLYGYKHLYQLKFPDNPLRDPITQIPSRDVSRFLSPDGPWNVAEIKNEIEKIADVEKPEIVITFFPDQPGTHAHHRATAALVDQQYNEHRLGPNVEGVFGFYEDPVASGAKSKLPLAADRIEFSPLLLSLSNGPYRGRPYGEVGTKAALAHTSQLKGDTGNFIRNWKTNPPETLAPIHSPHGLLPLLDALGDVKGMKVFRSNKLNKYSNLFSDSMCQKLLTD